MSAAPPAMAPACDARNLTKVFGEGRSRPIITVNNVTLTVGAGSFMAVTGPSNSGKSTLMHCVAGPDRTASGSAWIGDQDLSRLPEQQVTEIWRDKIGFVFQSSNLLPTLMAEQNILLSLELAGRKPDREVFREIVDSLGLAERLIHRPSQFSEDQRQRVAITRALVTHPQMIFTDEPTGTLDSRMGTTLLQYLQRCSHEQGQTIIMITHDPKVAGYAGRALVPFDGNIVDDVARPSAEIMLASLGRLGA